MNRNRTAIISVLLIVYIILSIVTFVNGIVLFYEPSDSPVSPSIGGLINRIIIAIMWYFVALCLVLKSKSLILPFIVLLAPTIVMIAHSAGMNYLLTETIGVIITNDSKLYPTIEFLFSLLLFIILLVIITIRLVREHGKNKETETR